MRSRYSDPPTGRAESEYVAVTSVSDEDVDPRTAFFVDPAVVDSCAAEPFTEYREAVPVSVYAPPVSAEPNEPVAVRPKPSFAIVVDAGADTVIDLLVESVVPWSSVTVSFTVYEPVEP